MEVAAPESVATTLSTRIEKVKLQTRTYREIINKYKCRKL